MPARLPTELIDLICQKLVEWQESSPRSWMRKWDKSTLANLRLVSRHFDQVASPHLFRELNIEINERCTQYLEFIATSRHVRDVRCVCIGAPPELYLISTPEIFYLGIRLRACLESFANLTSLSFSAIRFVDVMPQGLSVAQSEIKFLLIFRDLLLRSNLPNLSELLIQLPEGSMSTYMIRKIIRDDYSDEWARVIKQLRTLAFWQDHRGHCFYDESSHHLESSDLDEMLGNSNALQCLSLTYTAVYADFPAQPDNNNGPVARVPLNRLGLSCVEIDSSTLCTLIKNCNATLQFFKVAETAIRDLGWEKVFETLATCSSLVSVEASGLRRKSLRRERSVSVDRSEIEENIVRWTDTIGYHLEYDAEGKLLTLDKYGCFSTSCDWDEVHAFRDLLVFVEDNRRSRGLCPDLTASEYIRIHPSLRQFRNQSGGSHLTEKRDFSRT